jgi:hypothetical protein
MLSQIKSCIKVEVSPSLQNTSYLPSIFPEKGIQKFARSGLVVFTFSETNLQPCTPLHARVLWRTNPRRRLHRARVQPCVSITTTTQSLNDTSNICSPDVNKGSLSRPKGMGSFIEQHSQCVQYREQPEYRTCFLPSYQVIFGGR